MQEDHLWWDTLQLLQSRQKTTKPQFSQNRMHKTTVKGNKAAQ